MFACPTADDITDRSLGNIRFCTKAPQNLCTLHQLSSLQFAAFLIADASSLSCRMVAPSDAGLRELPADDCFVFFIVATDVSPSVDQEEFQQKKVCGSGGMSAGKAGKCAQPLTNLQELVLQVLDSWPSSTSLDGDYSQHEGLSSTYSSLQHYGMENFPSTSPGFIPTPAGMDVRTTKGSVVLCPARTTKATASLSPIYICN